MARAGTKKKTKTPKTDKHSKPPSSSAIEDNTALDALTEVLPSSLFDSSKVERTLVDEIEKEVDNAVEKDTIVEMDVENDNKGETEKRMDATMTKEDKENAATIEPTSPSNIPTSTVITQESNSPTSLPSSQEDESSDDMDQADDPKDNQDQDTDMAVDDSKGVDGDDDDDGDGEEDQWDLKHVFSIDELNSSSPQMCMTDGCPLTACSTYISSIEKEVWHSCLDCQEKDYGGWPDKLKEFPIKFMSEEHRMLISEKCTGQYTPLMPDILPLSLNMKVDNNCKVHVPSDSPKPASTTESDDMDITSLPLKENTSAVTPHPPSSESKEKAKETAKKTTKKSTATNNKTKKSTVTPSPPAPKKTKQDPKTMAMYNRWQETANGLGAGGEKIIVRKSDAKKKIFDYLKDEFRPMNITTIFQNLKGIVPSSVLKSCLDDMALDKNDSNPFDESDDEETNGKPKPSKKLSSTSSADEYAGSLKIKIGRNSSSTLYYVDQTKLFNNGDGLVPEDKNTLLSDLQMAKASRDEMLANIKHMSEQTSKLLSEPTNVDATSDLETQMGQCEKLRDELEESRYLKENSKYREQLQKRVENMAKAWRQRKRINMDFLFILEDLTEGTIAAKKCLSGDGQIELDSDEAMIKSANAFAKQKKQRKAMMGNKRSLSKGVARGGIKKRKHENASSSCKSDVVANESFIGVKLDGQKVLRVYFEE